VAKKKIPQICLDCKFNKDTCPAYGEPTLYCKTGSRKKENE